MYTSTIKSEKGGALLLVLLISTIFVVGGYYIFYYIQNARRMVQINEVRANADALEMSITQTASDLDGCIRSEIAAP
jgi:hypothetical protein